jgi:hypothetical protein
MQALRELIDFDAAREASRALEAPALALCSVVGDEEALEIFRRVGAGEIKTGDFLRSFGEAVAAADLPNKALLLPTCYKLLAKYPYLLERHREKPSITSFPPDE